MISGKSPSFSLRIFKAFTAAPDRPEQKQPPLALPPPTEASTAFVSPKPRKPQINELPNRDHLRYVVPDLDHLEFEDPPEEAVSRQRRREAMIARWVSPRLRSR